MLDRIQTILQEALGAVGQCGSVEELRKVEVHYLGRRGAVTALLKSMGSVAPEDRKEMGKAVNLVKRDVTTAIQERRSALEREALERSLREDTFDMTLPSRPLPMRMGTLHPVTMVQQQVERTFEQMGFKVLDYGEVEDDWHNFGGLNIPEDHPARDMQDTFWLESGTLLRTHTSPGQVRALKEFPPPFRAIFPGRVFRYERTDASHEHTFHQIEGLMIGRDLSVAVLVGMMRELLEAIFEREMRVRLRPGYFPFVEPGFELDMECTGCGGSGCSVCKGSGWVELLPCGLVHPNVIRSGDLDPDEWVGWAFGLGLSRLAMMKYKITHITHFMGSDMRFLRQFEAGGAQ